MKVFVVIFISLYLAYIVHAGGKGGGGGGGGGGNGSSGGHCCCPGKDCGDLELDDVVKELLKLIKTLLCLLGLDDLFPIIGNPGGLLNL
ncbi:UV excision repair protein RAD23 homolog B-like [Sitodiplosis mosellana]|uniref:UV excision repair protein RAD23 homolog B-like n=1 Tax=Sitodiplosis mosellana TaxID=263140 RepID=UPI002443AB0A|nr:UV excision repair protein RAD23 homolog B-like [Sitodiplosis mosellana]